MPILTFWVSTPSGASARADLPLRKGHFAVVQGSKTACAKVIHKMWKTGNQDSAETPVLQAHQIARESRGSGAELSDSLTPLYARPGRRLDWASGQAVGM